MSNIDAAMREIVEKWSGHLDNIATHQDELKALKAEAKTDGYNLRCLAQVVKERRKGAKFQAEQMQLELELDTYRKAEGLPVELEDAQRRAAREAAGEDGDGPSVFGENDTVMIGDGPEIPARELERLVRSSRSRGKRRLQ